MRCRLNEAAAATTTPAATAAAAYKWGATAGLHKTPNVTRKQQRNE